MMWVKLTLPPRARRRWLLITTRLSASSFAGTARTLVAVGTVRDSSMLETTRAAAPRRVIDSPGGTGPAAACFGPAGGTAGAAAGAAGGAAAAAGWDAAVAGAGADSAESAEVPGATSAAGGAPGAR